MEGEKRDPYEKQLLAVFNSCLEKGGTVLSTEGLEALCRKLQLEEQSQDLIALLLAQDARAPISFETFRDALLQFLGQTQERSQQDSNNSKDEDEQSSIGPENVTLQTNRIQCILKGEDVDSTSVRLSSGSTQNGEINHCEMCRLTKTMGYATIPKEIVEEIFEKLDMDCDGLISVNEFSMLFDNGLRKIYEDSRGGIVDWGNESSSDVTKANVGRKIDDVLGPHQSGYALASTIIGMWEIAGVSEAGALLSDLGFTSVEIRLTDLTRVLCEELKNLRDEPADKAVTSTHMRLLKGALTLYQEEVRCINTLVEQLRGERDKLRIDVSEANERANLLAQEIDEHQVRLERSRQEQLKQLEIRHGDIMRDLSMKCRTEREGHVMALKAFEDQLESSRNEEQQLRAKLAEVLRENQSLENEVESLCDQVERLKSRNGELVIQVQHLAAEHEELVSTSEENQESEHVIQLVDRIKKLQSKLTLLRDENDELTAELEIIKNRSVELKSDRKNNSDDVRFDPCLVERFIIEVKSLLKADCALDHCDLKNSISKAIVRFESRELENPITHETRSKEIEVTSEISLSSRKELEVECEERASESLRDLVVVQMEKSKLGKCISQHSGDTDNDDNEAVNAIEKNVNNYDSRSVANPRNKVASLRDYPPRKEEGTNLIESMKIERDDNENKETNSSNTDAEEKLRESVEIRIRETEAAKHMSEKKQLTDRCVELERSLDLLRSEYEQCEDYWASKLEEERQIFEQEQKISDDKFSELIAKMAEYEEQFGPDDKTRSDGRLSPIEEKFNLEQQYADLEEEYEDLKAQMSQLVSQKENEIKELRDKFSSEKQAWTSSVNVATQCPPSPSLDEKEAEGIPKENSSNTYIPIVKTHSSCDWHNSPTATIRETSKKQLRPEPGSFKQLESYNLNENSQTSVSNSLNTISSPRHIVDGLSSQQIDVYNSMEELCRIHKIEIGRLYQKKLEIDKECASLTKEKETLMKGVAELKNSPIINRLYSQERSEESNSGNISINVLKALNEKLEAQEKKKRNLKMSLVHQQHQAERIFQQTWQQHCQEVNALRFALQGTNQQLKKQIRINEEQADRLAKADILSTDLYVQNAHLVASIKRLEQHCHTLAQFGGESTSV